MSTVNLSTLICIEPSSPAGSLSSPSFKTSLTSSPGFEKAAPSVVLSSSSLPSLSSISSGLVSPLRPREHHHHVPGNEEENGYSSFYYKACPSEEYYRTKENETCRKKFKSFVRFFKKIKDCAISLILRKVSHFFNKKEQ